MLTKKDKHLAAAQKYMERGQLDRAREEFARVVQEDPTDTRTWLKLAEIHVRRGAIQDARDIYLRTAELYVAQGFVPKAVTVYKSVLKLTPGMPHVRERLADAYRQLGMVADALRELGLAADELQQSGRAAESLPALRRIVGLHPDNVGSRVRLAETASLIGAVDEAVHELAEAAAQLKQQGRMDEFVRVSERLLFHRPQDFEVARELAAAYIARRNPRLAVAKLQGALKAAPRDPRNVSLFGEALAQLDPTKAKSVWRELAEIHDAEGRITERDAAVRAALVLDPTDGETRELAANWNVPSTPPARSRPPGAAPAPPSLPAVAGALRPQPSTSGVIDTGVVSGLSRIGMSGLTPAPGDDVARILTEADVFVKYGLVERAVDHLRRVFAIEPHHRGARERLATVLNQLGRRSEAAAELATLAGQLGNSADSALVAERALTLDPSCTAAAALLGREAAEAKPRVGDDLVADLEQVDFFMQQSLLDDARDVLEELERRFPRHPLLAAKRVALEAAAAVAALPSDSDPASEQHPGAIPMDVSGEVEPPAARTGAVADDIDDVTDPGTHGDLGIAYKQMGLYDAAIGEFNALATDSRRAVFALTMIGECIEAKGELGEAVAKYKQALNQPQLTPPESLELYYLLGSVFERLGDFSEALYFFENLSKRDPRFRDVGQRITTLKPKQQARESMTSVTNKSGAELDARAAAYFTELQDRITGAIEAADGRARFQTDAWTRPTGGGGRTRALADGALFEKAGVGVSDVYGRLRPEMARALPGDGDEFRAMGLSLIFHPLSPRIPTVHANVRYIRRGGVSWFGGGTDLTPYYVVPADAAHFHRTLRDCCARHDPGFYDRFKRWCDDYFFLPHRNEPRGVGGIFFDYVGAGAETTAGQAAPVPPSPREADPEAMFAFLRDVGDAILAAYLPIVERRRNDPWGERERRWQQVRRGRYVEFNLLYDRGTVFGLRTDGRVESILMSLPPQVRWEYGQTPEPGSPEAESLAAICSHRDWAAD